MERPPEPFSATYAHQSPNSPSTATPDKHDHGYGYEYNEKYTAQQQQQQQQQRHCSARVERNSTATYGRPHDSVISPFSPKDSSSPPSPSNSSSSRSSINASIGPRPRHEPTPALRYSTSGVERQSIQHPPQAHLDPEKHAYLSSREADAIVYDQGKYHENRAEDKAWQLLFYLCGPCALLSGAIAIWTFVAVLIALLLAPLRLCTARPSLSEQLKRFLAPALNLQLHLVYSHDSKTGYSAPMLVIIHAFSPIVAMGVAIASWTAAGFFLFSSILGDPGGHDGHNDGKECIVGVRNWWERWLCRGLRESVA